MNPDRYPLLIAALFFACGIAIGRWLSPPIGPIILVSLACFLICLASFRRPYFFTSAALIFFLSLGCLRWVGSRVIPADDITRSITHIADRAVVLKGVVVSQSRSTGRTPFFILEAEELETRSSARNCSGKVLVFSTSPVSLGDKVKMYCELKKLPRIKWMAASFNMKMAARPISKVMVLPGGNIFLSRINNLKTRMLSLLSSYVSSQAKGLLNAMVLGEKEGVPRPVNEAMVKTGTVHILVVSGFNVGIVSTSLLLVLRLLRFPLRARIAIALPGVILYCLLTGASTPVVRATIVAAVFLCGCSLRREPDINNALGFAGLSVLAVWPEQLFDIGFQLSFSSVLAIVWIYPVLRRRLGLGSLRPQILRVLCEGGIVSFCAWCGTAGIIAYYFRFFSPVTVIANLFIVPLASLITLTGFCSFLTASFSPGLTSIFASSAEAMLKLLLSINALMLKLPAASFDFR